MKHDERLLRAFPRRWREHYGEEFVAMLELMTDERPLPLRTRVNVVRAGLVARLGWTPRMLDQERPRRAVPGSAAALGAIVLLGAGVAIGELAFNTNPTGTVARNRSGAVSASVHVANPTAVAYSAAISRAVAAATANGASRHTVVTYSTINGGTVILITPETVLRTAGRTFPLKIVAFAGVSPSARAAARAAAAVATRQAPARADKH